ncbi:MAG: GntR family transcriptional regulator [Caldilineaceae bacterium]
MDALDPAAAPLYVQIANSIAARISSGELAVGDQLASERQLAKELDVSRLTVRQALSSLRQKGLVDSQIGKGYFVRQPRIEQPVDVLIGFSDNMLKKGLRPGATVLSQQTILADRTLAPLLRVGVGEQIFHVHRVRTANAMPVALEYSYFPTRYFPDLDRYDLKERSIYAILAEEYDVHLAGAQQALEPVVATTQQAQLLAISKGAPLMLVTRTAWDRQERVVEFAEDYYRGDCFRFVSQSRTQTNE